jgi:hypothetical protein
MPWHCILERESDRQQWRTLAKNPDAAIPYFVGEVGKPLFICEGVGPYSLRCQRRNNPQTPTLFAPDLTFGVMEGAPQIVAAITPVATGYTLTIIEPPANPLLDEACSTEDEVLILLETALHRLNIPSQACQVKRLNWSFSRRQVNEQVR